MAPTELVVDSEEDLQLLLSMKRQLTEEEEEDEMPLSARKKARTASQSGASNQNLLPDEVWLSIMHEMTPRSLLALGSTCRRLLYLSRDPDLWTSMTIDWQAIKDQEENKNKHLDSALRRATKLQRLTIKNRTFEQIKSNVVAAVVKRAGCSLKDLIFSPEVVMSNSAVAALSSLSSLTSLELPGDWVKTGGAHAIASLTNLQSFKMPGAEQVTSSDLISIVSSLHNLRILDLSDAKKGVSDSMVTALSAANPHLEYLALDECERITGKGLRGLADNCHKLRHLSLDGCYQVNDPAIIRLATSCTQLAYLSLGLCSTVKDTSLKALATHCPRLAHLNLFGCAYISEKGVARLVEALGPRDLRYICIRGMLGVGQTFSERLVKDWPRMEVVHTFLPRPFRDRAKKF